MSAAAHQSPAAAFPAGSSAGALAPLHAGAPAAPIHLTATYVIRPYTTWIADRITMTSPIMGLLPVSLPRLSIQEARI